MFEKRIHALRERMGKRCIDLALITDEDTVYYLTGYYDYLHMEFGRPTILLVHRQDETLLITPAIDYNTALANARVDRVEPWNDGAGNEWREHLPPALMGYTRIAIEHYYMPPVVRKYISELTGGQSLKDITPVIADMRMIKSPGELKLARHAGEVATAMMHAGREAIVHGMPEYEVALVVSAVGTRKSAELLRLHYEDTSMSPNTHFLQIMASGEEITRTHHRASNRIMQWGEPVFLCFCGMTNFHRFKLGFDRTFWIGRISEDIQEFAYQVAVDSQAAALAELRPGVAAEDVHAAYAEVIQSAGYDYPFRCGRGTGFSFLEKPQLVFGDKTLLRPGMVLAIDGSVTTETFRAQIGDSFILTEDGYEAITSHPKSLEDVIIH
jgi:Xaa-Pro dipeptidase